MKASDIIKKLYDLGHFRNPKYPDLWNIGCEDLDKLTLDDKLVKQAMSSFQDFMVMDFERLVQKYHHHPPLSSNQITTPEVH